MHMFTVLRTEIICLMCGLFLLLVFTGCTTPSADSMIPVGRPVVDGLIDKTISVASVSGAATEAEEYRGFGMHLKFYAKNDQVREALIKSLSQSGIFRAVLTNRDSDLELNAKIMSQHFKDPLSRNTRSEIIINYSIVERRSNNVVWQKIIQSESGSSALAGATRYSEACQGAVRENIALFLQEIGKRGVLKDKEE
jgi:hypothetical protein